MNIITGLNQVREATTAAAANSLLKEGWQLISVLSKGTNITYILGWNRAQDPAVVAESPRSSGNLAQNARQ